MLLSLSLFSFVNTAHAQWKTVSNLKTPVAFSSLSSTCQYRLRVMHSSSFYGTINRYYPATEVTLHRTPPNTTYPSFATMYFHVNHFGESFVETVNKAPSDFLAPKELTVSLTDKAAPRFLGLYQPANNFAQYLPLKVSSALSTVTLEGNCR